MTDCSWFRAKSWWFLHQRAYRKAQRLKLREIARWAVGDAMWSRRTAEIWFD